MSSHPSLLLVEDDRSMATALLSALRTSYEVTHVLSGKLALYHAKRCEFDFVVLDLNLPDITGDTVCERLRLQGNAAPILMLSAENRILTKIKCLDAGANDYLTKPFSLGELKARLRALGRQQQPLSQTTGTLSASGIELNRQSCEVSRDGITIDLRRKEFAILACLMEHAGSVVSRDMLIRYVWPENTELWTNTIDVHIKYLRDKIDRPFGQQLIKTVHGRGYKLEKLSLHVTSEL